MTYQDFIDCINEYKIALLEMIPVYYSNTSDNLVEVEPPEDAKDAVTHLMDKRLLPQGNKEKIVFDKKSSTQSSDFTEKMKKVLRYIDTFAQEKKWERFRFRFFEKEMDKYREANLISGSIEEDVKSIDSSFRAYLRYLRDNGYDECNACDLVTKKMHSWEKKYLQEYGDRIKKSLGDKTGRSKNKKRVSVDFNDVKLEMTVDSKDSPLFDAIVSANEVDREKLKLEDRFLEPLYFLAKTVKEGKNNGWVYNKDLKDKYSKEGTNKIKYEIIKAFKKVIGTGAMDIITIKHGSAKKLMIPKKNIKFKSI